MPYGNLNVDTVTTSTTGGVLGAGNASIMKNRIINGAMVIDQRNGGASVNNSAGYTFGVDRWQFYGSNASKYSFQQSSTAPAGFATSTKITSLAATTVGSDVYMFRQQIEGYNIADLNFGSANAKTVTLSFWVNCSLTGTFGGSITNKDSVRSYPFTYTISAANTWEQKSITIAGDTSGTWQTTNDSGLQVWLGLGVGSANSGTAGSWATASYWSATGATNFVSTNGATFYITGVQLEVGSSATGFEYRQYGTEVDLCHRYAVVLGTISGGYTITLGRGMSNGGSSGWRTMLQVLTPMRATPSLTPVNLTGWNVSISSVGFSSFATVYLINGLCLETDVNYSSSVGGSSGQVYLQTNGSGGASYVLVSAEL